MDIPASARVLLRHIRETETGFSDIRAYNTVYGHKEGRLPKPLTQMRLDYILKNQMSWSKRFGSSATGAYQFMNATLKGLSSEFDLKAEQIFDEEFQDYLGYMLLKRRGYDQWVKGTKSDVAFGLSLAQEWASFPVLASTKGAHRQVKRGQTYYSGDALNKALVKPETVEQWLKEARAEKLPLEPGTVVVIDDGSSKSWWDWFKGLFS